MPLDRINAELRFGRNFKVIIPSRSEWTNGGPIVDIRSLNWFTDGSKMDTGVGAGVYGPNTKISEPMGTWPTVFQAEIQAINICARINIEKGQKGAHISIFSDSQAALLALSSWSFSSKLSLECFDTLQKLSMRNRVTLFWIPGHRGLEGNEIADELARLASATSLIGPEPYCGVNWSTITSLIRETEYTDRLRLWDDSEGLRQSKLLINPFSYKNLLERTKSDIRLLTGFLSGHFKLNYHLCKMNLTTSALCRLCLEDDETTTHVLCECVALCRTRRQIFYREILGPEDIRNSSPSSVLMFIRNIIRNLE